MRIVLATPLYPPEIGGPATYAETLVRELSKKGVEVELVKFADVRYLPKLVRHVAYYRNVLNAAKNADLILVLDPVSVGLPVMMAVRRLKKPYVLKVGGDYAWEQGVQRFGIESSLDAFVTTSRVPFAVKMLRRIQSRVAQGAKRIIVPSAYLKYIVTTWGIPETKIEVLYNAVPMEPPGALPAALAALPRPLIVSVGRLVPWKGFDGLIEAVATLRAGGTKASLVIVGDGPERSALEALAREKLSPSSVHFGALSHGETLATIKNADAFVLNSAYEGLSHTLIEALSLGAPIIATRAGGNAEVIADDKNGLLVPVGDTAHLAHALACMIRDKTLSDRLRKGAKKSAARFSEETMVEATVEFLKHL